MMSQVTGDLTDFIVFANNELLKVNVHTNLKFSGVMLMSILFFDQQLSSSESESESKY